MASRYQTIQTTKLNVTGSLYYVTNIYPEIAPTDNDYYVITTVDDRLDLLPLESAGPRIGWAARARCGRHRRAFQCPR